VNGDNLSPLASIGLPVYNGEKYLREAIESLLAQDYGNFELIISDNASSDETFKICQEYQSTDHRIRLYKNDSNIGAVKNFNKVFKLSLGRYFMWAAHDDLWDKSYLSTCIAKLEANPTAVVCISEVQFIDAFGNKMDEEHLGMATIGLDVVERVHMLMSRIFWYEIYGVIRPEYLRKTSLVQGKYGADVILLMELLLVGDFIKIPEKMFTYRVQKKTRADHMAAIDPTKSLTEPLTSLARELLKVILKSDLDDTVKHQLQNKFIECLSFENVELRGLILHENRSKLPPTIQIQNLPQIMYSILVT
jgi:glycosyltransferase involved in cell wall biosynthesis